MPRIQGLLVGLVMAAAACPAHALTCQDLVTYRDGQLAQAMGKALDVNSRLMESRELIQRLQADAMKTRQGALTAGALRKMAVGIKTAVDGFMFTLGLSPSARLAMKAGLEASDRAQRLFKATSTAEVLTGDDVYRTAVVNTLADLNPMSAAIKGLSDLAEDISAARESVKDNTETLDSVDRALKSAEVQLDALSVKLRSQGTKMALINAYKNQIDAACNR